MELLKVAEIRNVGPKMPEERFTTVYVGKIPAEVDDVLMRQILQVRRFISPSPRAVSLFIEIVRGNCTHR